MVWFQKQYKLNELDVYKSAFQRKERKEKMKFIKGVKIYSAIYIFIVVAYSIFRATVLGDKETSLRACSVDLKIAQVIGVFLIVYISSIMFACLFFFIRF